MNLKDWNEVAIAALPSRNKVTTHSMFYTALVNGAAIDASASERLIPTSAVFRAPQSFAPSPHIPTYSFKMNCMFSTSEALSSGPILAKTFALAITLRSMYGFDSFYSIISFKALPVTATSTFLSR